MRKLLDFEHQTLCSLRTCLRFCIRVTSLMTSPGLLMLTLMGVTQCTPIPWTTSRPSPVLPKNNRAQRCPTQGSGRFLTSTSWTKITQHALRWWMGVIERGTQQPGTTDWSTTSIITTTRTVLPLGCICTWPFSYQPLVMITWWPQRNFLNTPRIWGMFGFWHLLKSSLGWKTLKMMSRQRVSLLGSVLNVQSRDAIYRLSTVVTTRWRVNRSTWSPAPSVLRIIQRLLIQTEIRRNAKSSQIRYALDTVLMANWQLNKSALRMEEKKRENFIFRLLNDDFILFFNILSLWQKIDRKVTESFLCHIVLLCLYFCVSLT